MQTIFEPVIEFFHFQDSSLGILFDPSGQSPERQAHSMMIPNFLKSNDDDQYPPYISVVAKNFTESVLGSKKIFLCDFFLIVDNREYIIGKYQETLVGKTKGFVRRVHSFGKTIAEFEQEIITKLSDTFSIAWQNYIFAQNSKNMVTQVNNSNASILPFSRVKQRNSTNNLKFAIYVALAAIVPILVISLIWGISKASTKDPIQQAMLDAMKSNPQAAQAQVDLTKETLKQMGLDTGKTGDVGCLAAPQ
ncbi:MAG: hypothetical protein RLZZ210_517 [Pseudomonadota bacterium]|jgi:hypothetical protein